MRPRSVGVQSIYQSRFEIRKLEFHRRGAQDLNQLSTQHEVSELLDTIQPISIGQRIRKAGALFRFGKLSVVSFAINLGLTITLHEWVGLATTLSFAITILFLYFFNFGAMRLYVFPVRAQRGHSVVKQATCFLISSAAFRALDYAAFLVLHLVFGFYYIATIIIVSGISFIVKYFFYNRWIFGVVKS